MLIREGEARSRTIDLLLAAEMSLIAGALNAVSFLIAGSFTANMTGNISMFSEFLARGKLLIALSFLGLLAAFIAGSALVALALQLGADRGVRSRYALAVLAEALILAALGGALLIWPGSAEQTHMVLVLSFVMGLQNAITTLISRAHVRTTHVSGMATDLGIELVAMTGSPTLRRETLPKLRLHSVTLFFFTAGGFCGVLLYALVENWLFVIAAVLLTLIALPEVVRSKAR